VKAESFYDISRNLADVFTASKPFTTGVAHGASGLAWTRCALSAVDTEDKIEREILAVLQWENEHYSDEDNNWFDLRDKTRKGFMSGWCSGAPGIGMARKHIEKHTQSLQIKKMCETDLKRAEKFLKAQSASKRDTLCCGTASKLMAASALGVSVDDLYTKLCDAERNQKLRISHLANTNDRNVSFMQGLSGIAYALAMYGDPLSGGMLI
jgi:lantibiotic modifying enzyme